MFFNLHTNGMDTQKRNSMPSAFLLSPILDQKENQVKIRAMIERSDEEQEGDDVFIQ
jgi:hypothetical protein